MINKNILVTGATGGIGSGVAKRLLELGYTVYAPVRNLQKAEEMFGKNPNFIPAVCNVEDAEQASAYIESLWMNKIMFKTLILAAGGLRYDHEFIENTQDDEEKKEIFKNLPAEARLPLEEASIKANVLLNTVTKENVIGPFLKFYKNAALETELVPIGSQAAGFEVGHPWRFDEEGYHVSQFEVRGMKSKYRDFFLNIMVAEPGLIDTPMTRIKFALNDDGTPRDWSKVMKPHEYAVFLLTEIGLN